MYYFYVGIKYYFYQIILFNIFVLLNIIEYIVNFNFRKSVSDKKKIFTKIKNIMNSLLHQHFNEKYFGFKCYSQNILDELKNKKTHKFLFASNHFEKHFFKADSYTT